MGVELGGGGVIGVNDRDGFSNFGEAVIFGGEFVSVEFLIQLNGGPGFIKWHRGEREHRWSGNGREGFRGYLLLYSKNRGTLKPS